MAHRTVVSALDWERRELTLRIAWPNTVSNVVTLTTESNAVNTSWRRRTRFRTPVAASSCDFTIVSKSAFVAKANKWLDDLLRHGQGTLLFLEAGKFDQLIREGINFPVKADHDLGEG